MLFKFELKRLIRGKDWLGMVCAMLVMIAAAVVNSVVVQPLYDGSKSIRFDYYCAVSQFMPFVFSPSVGNFFTRDYEEDNDLFYKNVGVASKTFHLTRLLVISLFGVIVIAVGTGAYFIVESVEALEGLSILLISLLQYLYVVLIIAIIACGTKKRIITIIAAIFGTMLMSLLNYIPTPVLKGKLFMLDSNSIITENMEQYIVSNDVAGYWLCIAFLVVWLVGLMGLYWRRLQNAF